jgi:hypothetical protein
MSFNIWLNIAKDVLCFGGNGSIEVVTKIGGIGEGAVARTKNPWKSHSIVEST